MEEGVLQVHMGWASWEVCHLNNKLIIIFRSTTKTNIIKQILFGELLFEAFASPFWTFWDYWKPGSGNSSFPRNLRHTTTDPLSSLADI